MTVTRQEYRVAREARTANALLRPFLFVRQEVIEAIGQWMEDGKPITHRSNRDWDPSATSEFMKEIQDDTQPDGAPWLYQFADFRDIIAALREPLALDLDLDRRLLRQNLLEELLYNLSSLVTRRTNGFAFVEYWPVSTTRDSLEITSDDLERNLSLTINQIKDIALISLTRGAKHLKSIAVTEAIRRGLFLEVQPETGELTSSEAHVALVKLSRDLEALSTYERDEDYAQLERRFFSLGRDANLGRLNEPVPVPAWDLIRVFFVHDRLDDIFRSSTMFAQWLMGLEPSPAVPANAQSPIAGQDERLAAEQIDAAELKDALTNRWYPFGPNPHPADADVFAAADERLVQIAIESIYAAALRTNSQITEEDIQRIARESVSKIRSTGGSDPRTRARGHSSSS